MGEVLETQKLASSKKCSLACYQNSDCQSYSYRAKDFECSLLSDCGFTDETCEDCIHGQRRCGETATPGKANHSVVCFCLLSIILLSLSEVMRLLIAGGYSHINDVESLDIGMGDEGQNSCPDLPTLPKGTDNAHGGYLGGKSVVCGGSNGL